MKKFFYLVAVMGGCFADSAVAGEYDFSLPNFFKESVAGFKSSHLRHKGQKIIEKIKSAPATLDVQQKDIEELKKISEKLTKVEPSSLKNKEKGKKDDFLKTLTNFLDEYDKPRELSVPVVQNTVMDGREKRTESLSKLTSVIITSIPIHNDFDSTKDDTYEDDPSEFDEIDINDFNIKAETGDSLIISGEDLSIMAEKDCSTSDDFSWGNYNLTMPSNTPDLTESTKDLPVLTVSTSAARPILKACLSLVSSMPSEIRKNAMAFFSSQVAYRLIRLATFSTAVYVKNVYQQYKKDPKINKKTLLKNAAKKTLASDVFKLGAVLLLATPKMFFEYPIK